MIWLGALVTIQVMQARLARRFAGEAAIPEQYWRLSTLWSVFGALATILLLVALYFKVFKPE